MERIIQPNQQVLKIALVGAESTGKTTLAQQLAAHYDTLWVPEFAREYIANLSRPYTLEDIEQIAQQHQLNIKREYQHARKYLFVDTEMIILKVWCQEKFHSIPQSISDHLLHQQYDLYLVLENDLPWVADSVRENPDKRDYLKTLYLAELEKLNALYFTVSGIGKERLQKIIEELDFFECELD